MMMMRKVMKLKLPKKERNQGLSNVTKCLRKIIIHGIQKLMVMLRIMTAIPLRRNSTNLLKKTLSIVVRSIGIFNVISLKYNAT